MRLDGDCCCVAQMVPPMAVNPVFTVTEAIYKAQGFHYILAHVTGTVNVDDVAVAMDDVSDTAWVPSATPELWPSLLLGGVIVPETDSVVAQAVAFWKARLAPTAH